MLLNRTRFGFDLRATGTSETAAVACGVNVQQMMLDLDAALRRRGRADRDADVVRRRPQLRLVVPDRPRLHRHRRGAARPQPPGRIAFGALIFAFLSEQATLLNILAGISPDIIPSPRASIVLAVVIAYELVRRYRVRLEQRAVADELADRRRRPEAEEVPA